MIKHQRCFHLHTTEFIPDKNKLRSISIVYVHYLYSFRHGTTFRNIDHKAPYRHKHPIIPRPPDEILPIYTAYFFFHFQSQEDSILQLNNPPRSRRPTTFSSLLSLAIYTYIYILRSSPSRVYGPALFQGSPRARVRARGLQCLYRQRTANGSKRERVVRAWE